MSSCLFAWFLPLSPLLKLRRDCLKIKISMQANSTVLFMKKNELLSFVCLRPPHPQGTRQIVLQHSTLTSQTEGRGPTREVRAAPVVLGVPSARMPRTAPGKWQGRLTLLAAAVTALPSRE